MTDIELVGGPLDGFAITWRYGEPDERLVFPVRVEYPAQYEAYTRDKYRDSDHVLIYRWSDSDFRRALT